MYFISFSGCHGLWEVLADSEVFFKFKLFSDFGYYSCTSDFKLIPWSIIANLILLNQHQPPLFLQPFLLTTLEKQQGGRLEWRKNGEWRMKEKIFWNSLPLPIFFSTNTKKNQNKRKINSKEISTPTHSFSYPPPTYNWVNWRSEAKLIKNFDVIFLTLLQFLDFFQLLIISDIQ